MRNLLPHQPFLYVIGWTALDTYYLGIRYAKGCQPSDLWSCYFTSSRHVAQFRKHNGEPDVIEVLAVGDREEVNAWEFECITEFSLHTDDKWLNRNAGGRRFVSRAGVPMPESEKARRRGPRKPYGPRRARGRNLCGTKRHKLTDDQVRAIRLSSEGNSALARVYGVDREAIRCVKLGLSYKWVT